MLEETGLVVSAVMVLIDRQQGGAKEVEKAGCKLLALFPLDQLLNMYVLRGRMQSEIQDEILAYVAANQVA